MISTVAWQLLASFDALPEKVKFEASFEILRRTKNFEFPPLPDDELVADAEAVFLKLDRMETSND
jgi:hypothetical protein